MKKNIFYFILGAIIFSGITAFAATTIPSHLVSYDNSTSGLPATNVKGAIDYLYANWETEEPGLDLSQFVNAGMEQGLVPASYTETFEGYNVAKTSLSYSFDSTSDFEITEDVIYKNPNDTLIGGISLYFYLENNIVGYLMINDGHAGYKECNVYAKLNSLEITPQDEILNETDCSGRYSIVRKNGTVNVYHDNNSLVSASFTEEFQFDRIDIMFKKYQSYGAIQASIKNLYVGDIINYTE